MVEKPELVDGFKFRSDHRALDLTATVSGRKRNAPSDALKSGTDLARWLRAAGLGETLRTNRTWHWRGRLREAIYGLVLARVQGVSLE